MAVVVTDNCIQCRKDTKLQHWVEVWDNHSFSPKQLDNIWEEEPHFNPENTRHCFFLCDECFQAWRERQDASSGQGLERVDAVIDIARKKNYDVRPEGTPYRK